YPSFEVVVVNDGSVDRTRDLLDANFARDARVRLIHQSNHGKSASLSRAMREAQSSILTTIDADTSIDPHAIVKLVRHFADARVGAVAGKDNVCKNDR